MFTSHSNMEELSAQDHTCQLIWKPANCTFRTLSVFRVLSRFRILRLCPHDGEMLKYGNIGEVNCFLMVWAACCSCILEKFSHGSNNWWVFIFYESPSTSTKKWVYSLNTGMHQNQCFFWWGCPRNPLNQVFSGVRHSVMIAWGWWTKHSKGSSCFKR